MLGNILFDADQYSRPVFRRRAQLPERSAKLDAEANQPAIAAVVVR